MRRTLMCALPETWVPRQVVSVLKTRRSPGVDPASFGLIRFKIPHMDYLEVIARRNNYIVVLNVASCEIDNGVSIIHMPLENRLAAE